MDGVQLPPGQQSHFEEVVCFFQLSYQKFQVLILSISKGQWAESTLEPLSGLVLGTPKLGIKHWELGINH